MQSLECVRPKPNVSFYTLVTIIISTYVLTLGAAMLLNTKSNSEHILHMQFKQPLVLLFSITGVLLFWLADNTLTNSAWNLVTSSPRIHLQPTTTEVISNDSFLRRPWNCHSSIFLSAVGLKEQRHFTYLLLYHSSCYGFGHKVFLKSNLNVIR